MAAVKVALVVLVICGVPIAVVMTALRTYARRRRGAQRPPRHGHDGPSYLPEPGSISGERLPNPVTPRRHEGHHGHDHFGGGHHHHGHDNGSSWSSHTSGFGGDGGGHHG
ncbi:hypothetical protein ABIA32_004466 [Streptacidiphilus sp. MAP12-20]|uniref:hypothetical protein n=1 Tax=Streptacidiphilus sp. MAP12-20 TaxID=3156299 RepID=UPI003511EA74